MIRRVGRSWMTALLVAAGACGFDPSAAGPVGAIPPDASAPPDAAAPLEPVTVRIEAQIDGRSQLRMIGSTVQWYHLEYAAPGRHAGEHLPTLIDGVAWFPSWPDEPDDENRDCQCLSDIGEVFDPPLPLAPAVATVTPIEVRRAATIVEQPTAGNGFATVVELDDTGEGGSDTYVVEVEIAPP